jgi:membrane protease YdiL (CAAX protease family)
MGPGALGQDLAGQLVFVLLAAGGARWLPGRSLGEQLSLGPARLGARQVALALLGFLLLSNALHGLVAWLGALGGTTLDEIDRVAREQSGVNPGWLWLAFALGPALGEELLFRGFLQRLLALRWPGAPAVLLAALVFGLAHLDAVQGSAAFVLGAYLGALTARAGSLRPAILAHVANNSLALAASAGALPAVQVPQSPAWLALVFLGAGVCLAGSLRAPLQPPSPPADEMRTPQGPM